MANGKKCRVILYAKTDWDTPEGLYLCGVTRTSGNWQPKDACKMISTDKGWRAIKYLTVGEPFEFKILRGRDWHHVEKGFWNEEIPNHHIVPAKGLVVEMYIPTFRQD